MYRVILTNLSADARSVLARNEINLSGVASETLGELLRNFCEIDPIENANAGTEIRVQVRRDSYLLNAEYGKLILYEMQNRDLPGQIFTWEEAMKELDGSAAAARYQAIKQARAEAEPVMVEPLSLRAMPAESNWVRLIVLSLATIFLSVAIHYLRLPSDSGRPADFKAVESAETPTLQRSLAGVYLTGSEPGQHGVVIAGSGELKLFELEAVDAPRVVYASYKLGRVGAKLFLATDQPGGSIEIINGNTLVYCGENYRRIH